MGILNILSFFIPLVLFTEVLLGPSTFGQNTYSYNFAKLDYQSEVKSYPLYSVLKEYRDSTFIFIQEPSIFTYPFAIDYYGLKTLNSYLYYFGSHDEKKLIEYGFYSKYSDIVVSTVPIESDLLELLKVVEFGAKFTNPTFMHFTNLSKYKTFEDTTKWDQKLYVYQSEKTNSSLKYPNSNPIIYKNIIASTNILNGELSTSYTYSKNWIVKPKSVIFKDNYGYLGLKVSTSDQQLQIIYFNKIIYVGLIVSLSIFFAIVFFRKYLKEI